MSVSAIVGYDGSPASNLAVDAGARLFRNPRGWITYLWGPPFVSDKMRRRLRMNARNLDELIEMVEREGEHEAQRFVTTGVTLARAAGWDAEPLLRRTWGADGLRIGQIADELQADVVLVGARGLGGAKAVLGSVSDMVVHTSARPVIVVPHPMLAAEYAALADGPVVVGWDGSAGAHTAFAAATRLFPDREVVLVSVNDRNGDVSAPGPPEGGGRHVTSLNVERGHGFHNRGIADALIEAAREHDAAVIVVGSRGRSAVREVLLGSVAMGTLHHAHRPVMVVPEAWSA